tara:strand:+ start:1354 stop:1461 length:108 start_codon:yes stop_codon:yes gene_type:complete
MKHIGMARAVALTPLAALADTYAITVDPIRIETAD